MKTPNDEIWVGLAIAGAALCLWLLMGSVECRLRHETIRVPPPVTTRPAEAPK